MKDSRRLTSLRTMVCVGLLLQGSSLSFGSGLEQLSEREGSSEGVQASAVCGKGRVARSQEGWSLRRMAKTLGAAALYASGQALSGTQQAMGSFSGQSGSAIAPFLVGTTVLTLPSYVGGEHLSWEGAPATLEPGVGPTVTASHPQPLLRKTVPPMAPATVTVDEEGELECSLPVTHSSTDGDTTILLEMGAITEENIEAAIKAMNAIVCRPHITRADANALIEPILAEIIEWVLKNPVNHINFLQQNYSDESLIKNRILKKTVTSQHLKKLFNKYITQSRETGDTSAAEEELYSYLDERVKTEAFRGISRVIVLQTLRAMYDNTAHSHADPAIYQKIHDKVEGIFASYEDGEGIFNKRIREDTQGIREDDPNRSGALAYWRGTTAFCLSNDEG
ncbi:MAG: hypothetical protein Q8Q56_00295, partial [Alphaproteobacteria bacterium]|nr:hypothetical protein [Alphaproteobacteria bacterium]